MPLIVKNEERTYKFAMDEVTIWQAQEKAKSRARSIQQSNESAWTSNAQPRWGAPAPAYPKFVKGDCGQYFNKGRCADPDNCGLNHTNTKYPDGKGRSKGKKGDSKGAKGDSKGAKGDSKGAQGDGRTRSESADIVCYKCGKKGHKSSECWTPTQNGRDRSQSRDSKGKGKGKEKGKGKGRSESQDSNRDKCKVCGKTNHTTADCKNKAPVCQGHYKVDCTTPNCQKYHPGVCTFWKAGTCQKPSCIFLHRNSTWTKSRTAAPAPYETPRADSPAPLTRAQKKQEEAAQKAKEEKAAANKERRAASKARKKAATGAVAIAVPTTDGMSPLNM